MEKCTRKTNPPVTGYRLLEERAQLRSTASPARRSLSAYLLNASPGYPMRGDQRGVDELLRVNGDLGRLGGLLKLWFTNDERRPAFGEAGGCRLLAKTEATQGALLEVDRTVLMPGVDRQQF